MAALPKKVIAPENRKILPLLARVLVKKIVDHSEKTKSGIILPASHSSDNAVTMAKVIAVGPGEVNEEGVLLPVNVKEGDTVLVAEYGGTRVKMGKNEDLILYNDEDIVGIIHD